MNIKGVVGFARKYLETGHCENLVAATHIRSLADIAEMSGHLIEVAEKSAKELADTVVKLEKSQEELRDLKVVTAEMQERNEATFKEMLADIERLEMLLENERAGNGTGTT